MRLDSVRELKQMLRVRDALQEGAHAGAQVLAAGRPQAIIESGPAIALGAAPTETAGEYRLAVLVQRKELLGGREVERIVEAASGEADVVYVGIGFKQNGARIDRRRPLELGTSVGHPAITAGTLGCFIEGSGGTRILSNNHVLADEDRANENDGIVQPGRYDGGKAPSDVVGYLDDVEPLHLGGGNRMDAATARLAEGVDFDAGTVPGLGPLAGITDVDGTETLAKVGRTTGLTRGRIVGIDVDDVVFDYEKGQITFDSTIQIVGDAGLFTKGGDSGSLVVTDGQSPEAVGLHFGALEDGRSVIAPIGPILQRFGASLVR